MWNLWERGTGDGLVGRVGWAWMVVVDWWVQES